MLIETAYSSKGHFKTADWMRLSLAALIVVPLLTSLVQAFFKLPEAVGNVLSFIGLLFSCLALTSVLAANKNKADEAMIGHTKLGNEYLALHKEMRVYATDGSSPTADQLAGWQSKISELDAQTSENPISFMGRVWSKFRIVEEMDLQWLVKPGR